MKLLILIKYEFLVASKGGGGGGWGVGGWGVKGLL